MGIKFGTLDVSDIKVGTSSVLKIYQGTNLVYPTGDTTPPSVPTGLTATNVVPNGVSWLQSTDDTTPQASIQYFLQRADDISFTINVTTISNWNIDPLYIDNTVSADTTYYYRVKARDEALNESAYSSIYTSVIPYVGETGIVAGGISSTTTVGNNCGAVVDGVCWFDITQADTVSVGDKVYTNPSGTTPFVGNGDYYNLEANFIVGTQIFSAQIDGTGTIVGSVFLCV